MFSVIIVTYNSEKTIRACIDSILKFEEIVEIIVVDNNSSDGTTRQVKEYEPQVNLIEQSTNLGFAKGNNLGAAFSKGEYLVFLNPDTRVLSKNDLDAIITTLINNPEFGLIGPGLKRPGGQEQLTVRNLPTVFRAFCEYVLAVKGSYDFYNPKSKELVSVESVVGACMVIKKDLFEKVGKFNEKYFLYFEDLDLCRSILKRGLKIGFLPKVTLEHIIGASGKNEEVSKRLIASAKIYHGLLSYYLITLIIRLSQLFKK